MAVTRIGIIGVGNISGIYLDNLSKYAETDVVAVADLDEARARSVADARGLRLALTPDALVAHPEVDVVVNLTVPAVHGQVSRRAIDAGKHVYSEKPLTIDVAEGANLVAAAQAKGVRLGCAPDTFLGPAQQTARATIDRGVIGDVVGVHAAMRSRGPEPWHPNPGFFYQRGGGPMLDMGPYYLTALVNLLGPIQKYAGMSRISFPERPVTLSNAAYYGQRAPEAPDKLSVEVPTHLAALLRFENGAIADLTTSFDVYSDWPSHPITVYGSEGTMRVPDPNDFDGKVMVSKGDFQFSELDLGFGAFGNERGLGVLDMVTAVRENRPHRASGELALHVLDVMLGVSRSSDEERFLTPDHTVSRPEALSADAWAENRD